MPGVRCDPYFDEYRQSRPSPASLPGSREAAQGYVAAPMLGTPDLAHARKLFVITSGKASSVNRAAAGAARVPIRQRSRCGQPDEVSRQCPDGADAGRHGGSPRVAAQERYRRPRRV